MRLRSDGALGAQLRRHHGRGLATDLWADAQEQVVAGSFAGPSTPVSIGCECYRDDTPPGEVALRVWIAALTAP